MHLFRVRRFETLYLLGNLETGKSKKESYASLRFRTEVLVGQEGTVWDRRRQIETIGDTWQQIAPVGDCLAQKATRGAGGQQKATIGDIQRRELEEGLEERSVCSGGSTVLIQGSGQIKFAVGREGCR